MMDWGCIIITVINEKKKILGNLFLIKEICETYVYQNDMDFYLC